MKRTSIKRGKGLSKGNKSLEGRSAIKSHKKLGNASNKKKVRCGEKKKTYKEIDESREHKCEGCGSWNRPLSHSHLVPVGYNNSLEASERNIRIHCISYDGIKGCHEKWEDGILSEVEGMYDFEENMETIRQLDNNFFNRKHIRVYGKAPK